MSDEQRVIEFMGIKEVKRRLSISRPSIYRLIAKGEFPKPVKLGNSSVWDVQELTDRQIQKLVSR